MLDLNAIKARCEAATPPPWEVAEAGGYESGRFHLDEYFVRRPGDDVAIAADIIDPDTCEPSKDLATFIAHARTDIPALIAWIEGLEAAMPAVIARAIAAEREACARIADGIAIGGLQYHHIERKMANEISVQIRARGDNA